MTNTQKEDKGIDMFLFALCTVMIFAACYAVMFNNWPHLAHTMYYVMNGYIGFMLIKSTDPEKFDNKNWMNRILTDLYYFSFGPLTLCVGLYKMFTTKK